MKPLSAAKQRAWGRRRWLQLTSLALCLPQLAWAQPDPSLPLEWLDPAGRPNALAQEALQLLQTADTEGLDPADYALTPVEAAHSVTDRASWNQQLSLALQRYANDLHRGRINPRSLGLRWQETVPAFDAQAWLHNAAAEGSLRQAAARLAPTVAPYPALRTALAQYRKLAAQPPLPSLPALPKKLLAGDTWAGLPALRQYLALLGDRPAQTPAPADAQVYEPALVSAVQVFQQRHGLEADGVLGRVTLATLQVPLAQRVRQIELSMERLRWLPPLTAPRGLAINIPSFRLRAWEGPAATARPGPGMAVIVGKALDTKTPLMLETLRYLIFRPYWNVPRSILLKEILPTWQRRPGYLAQQDLEIVRGPGDDAQVLGISLAHLPGLRSGELRLRQRPGPRNSLGQVKFVFPNDEAIYLHGTPAPQLFQRARRDFSHGCVRVEDPVTLATWLLQDLPGWDRPRIEAAMREEHNLRVTLPQPLPVLLYYLTALVSPDDGRPHFFEDLYGHDARLEQALARRRVTHQ